MTKLQWDLDGQRQYEAGVRNCALYVRRASAFDNGVAWNGITAVSENPSGAEESKLYADDATYAIMYSPEEYGFTIEAYTYPDEFAECNGEAEVTEGGAYAMQKRLRFGLVYETRQGNDTTGIEENGKRVLHVVFNAYAKPTSANYSTINDSPDAITFSWECDTLPAVIEKPAGPTDQEWAAIIANLGGLPEPVSNMDIIESELTGTKYDDIRNKLYGTDSDDPKMLTPGEIIYLLNQ